jgi:hypothetical protein
MSWEDILKRESHTKLIRNVSFTRQKAEELKPTGQPHPTGLEEMNKHKLFMQAKQIIKLVNNRKKPSAIQAVAITDPNDIIAEENQDWFWSGFKVYGSGDLGFAGLEPNMTRTAQAWIDKLIQDIEALDLEGTEIESEIGEY